MEEQTAPERKEHLFIVRIWQEIDDTMSSEWRGYVEHVSSQRRLHFTDFMDLTDFISWRLHHQG